MRTLNALVTYREADGKILKRESVSVIYTCGEPHPKDRVISIELEHKDGIGKCVILGLRSLEGATGLMVREKSEVDLKRVLSESDKTTIRKLYLRGKKVYEISAQLNIDGRKVSGIISNSIRRKIL